MSYTKQTWSTGDTVTATKLNHMEDGIAGAGASYDVVIKLDKEFWDELLTASDLHLIQGDHASLMAKVSAHELITAFVYSEYTVEDTNIYSTPYGVSVTVADDGLVSISPLYGNDGGRLIILLDSNNDLSLD